MSTFKAVFAEQIEGKPKISIQQIDRASLPAGDVLVRVRYSDLNYKDGLAVTGRPGVIRKYPMIPGVDLAGVVEESSSPDWKPGDEVVVTGFGLSETAWGGYAELARMNADWLVRLPKGLTLKQSMAIGTAGFTAMQCVVALEQHGLVPDSSKRSSGDRARREASAASQSRFWRNWAIAWPRRPAARNWATTCDPSARARSSTELR